MNDRWLQSRRGFSQTRAGTGVIVSTVPVTVLATFRQRPFIYGLTAGTAKG
jgi:ABC-type glycerol-3-phosphate transport system permease component